MATEDRRDFGNKQLLVIDTDSGVDDILAILLALSYPDEWQVVAITCVHGNIHVDNACKNVMRTLVVSENTQIPIHRGCGHSLVYKAKGDNYHGEDGLGNVADQFSTGDLKISEGHAVNILTKLARQYPNQITLLALGPLTNIAIAHRIDPEFTKLLKALVIMGGTLYGDGNATPSTEYNFHCDPESAHVILAEASCPVRMVPLETTVEHGMDWAEYEEWIQVDTKKGHYVKEITALVALYLRKTRKTKLFVDCDFQAAAAALCPQCIKDTIQCPVTVETAGMFTRGYSVVDRYSLTIDRTNTEKKIEIVTKFNDSVLNELRYKLVLS